MAMDATGTGEAARAGPWRRRVDKFYRASGVLRILRTAFVFGGVQRRQDFGPGQYRSRNSNQKTRTSYRKLAIANATYPPHCGCYVLLVLFW